MEGSLERERERKRRIGKRGETEKETKIQSAWMEEGQIGKGGEEESI